MTVDPLVNQELEEEVLSSMMDGAKVRSLTVKHFTSLMRQQMYALLAKGARYEELSAMLRELGHGDADLYYVGDVYSCPTIPRGARLQEAVDELKRLAKMRAVCAAADAWRKRVPNLSVDRALDELQRLVYALKSDQ